MAGETKSEIGVFIALVFVMLLFVMFFNALLKAVRLKNHGVSRRGIVTGKHGEKDHKGRDHYLYIDYGGHLGAKKSVRLRVTSTVFEKYNMGESVQLVMDLKDPDNVQIDELIESDIAQKTLAIIIMCVFVFILWNASSPIIQRILE